MLKKVLLLSISLGTISNSISMNNVIYRYNIPISITMGTVVGIGSRLYTNNIKYNIGIGLGMGVGAYFISKLFSSNDDHDQAGDQSNTVYNINEIDPNALQDELASLGSGFGDWHKKTLEEMNKFDIKNGNHKELLQVILRDFGKNLKNGGINIFKKLINKGLDINIIIDCYNNTPLHYAVYYKNTSIEKYLIDKGANTNVKNNGGRTAYQPY